MTARTLWIPAETLNAARLIAYAVEAGRVTCVAHYASEEAATKRAALLSEVHRAPFRVFAIVIEKRTVDDGRIPVARVVDRVGDVAAVVTLFALIPLVGLASMWEVFA